MAEGQDDKERWLSIKEAAARLGVHPATLRRWANQGLIPVALTPGGHRRFDAAEVERFLEQRQRLRVVAGLERIWAEQALGQARKELSAHSAERWLEVFDERERAHKRQLGRRLMGLLLRFVALAEGGEPLLEEARAIGREHARNAQRLGLPLSRALQAAMFFRDAALEAALLLPQTASIRPEASLHLLRRMNVLLNAVLLAIAEAFDEVPGREPKGAG